MTDPTPPDLSDDLREDATAPSTTSAAGAAESAVNDDHAAAAAASLAAIEHSLEHSSVTGPIVDVDEYIAREEEQLRRRTRLLQFSAPFVVIGALMIGLKLTGHLHRSGLEDVVRQGKQTAAAISATPAAEPSLDPAAAKAAADANADAENVSALTGGNGADTLGTAGKVGGNPTAADAVAMLLKGGTVKVSHTKKNPAVAMDLVDYVFRDMKPISRYDQHALATLAALPNRTPEDAARIRRVLRESVIPEYAKFVAAAERIHPKTPEVQQAHQILLQAAHLKLLGFQHIVESKGDSTGTWKFGVQGDLQAAEAYEALFRTVIGTLARDQGVKLS